MTACPTPEHDVTAQAARLRARCIANRANAARSTGPRTRRGKTRASRNALRHGLAARPFADDGRDTRRIAALICDPQDLLAHDQALIIAECCTLIAGVRRARAAALERMALDELAALERYERRALSRRRRAIAVLAGLSPDRKFKECNLEIGLAERTHCVRPPAETTPQRPALRPHDTRELTLAVQGIPHPEVRARPLWPEEPRRGCPRLDRGMAANSVRAAVLRDGRHSASHALWRPPQNEAGVMPAWRASRRSGSQPDITASASI